jgi:hypothetical protein
MPQSSDKSRWPRYSLRSLLLVVTVLCLWLGWRFLMEQERQALIRQIQDAGGSVTYAQSGQWFGYASERVVEVKLPYEIKDSFGVEKLNLFPRLDVRKLEYVVMQDGTPAYTGLGPINHGRGGVLYISFVAEGYLSQSLNE